jgi:hypothetical protein
MSFVAWADDNNGIPHGVGGDWADPRNQFVAPATSEYTLMVFDYFPAGSPPEFEIHMDGIVPCNTVTKELTSGPDRDGSAIYPDFSDVFGLTLNGTAAPVGTALRLTTATQSEAGSAFTTVPITLGPGGSFSTNFSFQITNSGGGGADGIAFVVHNDATGDLALGGGGGNMGYSGLTPSLAVEFDSWFNGGALGDTDANHVGTGINGVVGSGIAVSLGAPPLDGGSVFYSWVDYDGIADVLEVRLATTNVRPGAPDFVTSRHRPGG